MLYVGIVGSRSHGINIARSDTDISILRDTGVEYSTSFLDGINTLTSSLDRFKKTMISEDAPVWYFTQWLFPEIFLVKNGLTDYVIENRDKIIRVKHPIVYNTLMKRANGLEYHANFMYKKHPKRMAYSTLFYSVLANYAEGMPFAKAHRPEGELHDFLIDMRLGKIPLEDAMERNKLERLRAEKAAGFYKEMVQPEVLREFEQILQDEVEKERI